MATRAAVRRGWARCGLRTRRGERLSSVPQHQRVALNARVDVLVDVVDPSASVYIYNEEHRAVVIATTAIENERSGHFEAGEEVVFSFSFDNVLSPGATPPCFNSLTAVLGST